jgi:aldehyde dehydrogenase (NAD+)
VWQGGAKGAPETTALGRRFGWEKSQYCRYFLPALPLWRGGARQSFNRPGRLASRGAAAIVWSRRSRRTPELYVMYVGIDDPEGWRVSSPHTLPDVHIHVGDTLLANASGGVHSHVFSATGQIQAEIPLAGKVEMDAAVEAAADAFNLWRRWKPTDRRNVLFRLAQLLVEHGSDFARLATHDNGTPVSFAQSGPGFAKEWVAYYAGWADKLEGQVTSTYGQGGEFSYSLAEPYGVIGIIITWNGPLVSLAMKAVPAIAAGNTVVVKPSELTPFSGELFMQLARKAGIPAGVINMVPGSVAAGEALIAHPKVQKVSFTGGPATARKILAACAPLIKPAVMELGGKSANIIFPDADLEAAARTATLYSLIALSGQICAAPTRLLVHEQVHDAFVDRILSIARAIRVGDPWDSSTDSGPVITHAAADRIVGLVEKARKDGAGKLQCGGGRVGGKLAKGAFVNPTVFSDVDPQSELGQQEIFGPVLSVMKFRDDDEAVRIANATQYGLAGFIHTRDAERLHRLAEEIQAGAIYANGGSTIAPNTPFGGRGLSGYGREGGRQGIEEFIRPKTVAIGR